MHNIMNTYKNDISSLGAIIQVIVKQPMCDKCLLDNAQKLKPIETIAQIDTGADNSCISNNIATSLNLKPLVNNKIITVNSETETNSPKCGVGFLFNNIYLEIFCNVVDMSKQKGVEVLLGRDFLKYFIFEYNGIDNFFTLEYKSYDNNQ